MRKSLRKSSYYKVGESDWLPWQWMGRACLCLLNPLLNPGIGRCCILCPGRPRCLLPWKVVVHGWIKKAEACVCVSMVDEAHPWLACLVKITVPPVFAAHLHHRLRMLAWWVSSVLYSSVMDGSESSATGV